MVRLFRQYFANDLFGGVARFTDTGQRQQRPRFHIGGVLDRNRFQHLAIFFVPIAVFVTAIAQRIFDGRLLRSFYIQPLALTYGMFAFHGFANELFGPFVTGGARQSPPRHRVVWLQLQAPAECALSLKIPEGME